MFEPQLPTRVAAAVPGRLPAPVRLTGDRPVSPAAGRHLRRTIAYLHDTLGIDPSLSQQPLLVSAATQLLAASVLNAFPSTASADPTSMDRRDAHPLTVRRAMAHIDAHAQTDLGLADIATAVHVNIRTLQFAFRRHLDTTPMGYLRRVRLAHAHAELLRADPPRRHHGHRCRRPVGFPPARPVRRRLPRRLRPAAARDPPAPRSVTARLRAAGRTAPRGRKVPFRRRAVRPVSALSACTVPAFSACPAPLAAFRAWRGTPAPDLTG
ncbi:AraC family transcriptional regulator [Streptomyces sp. NPDC047070]|uniref:AraC family transcriptional regulator n=1 Tax=Streptomyces sp. NPDC047070 TaxID=3154923 RepID=UPI00345538A5